MRQDGSEVGTPSYVMLNDYYNDGFIGLDGVGNDVYALLGGNSANQYHGEILKLQPDGGFSSVYTAPFELSAFDVAANGHVWAVGFSNDTAIKFDGTTWQEITLPLTTTRGNVRFENISVLPDGIVLSGQEKADAGRVAIINTYRFAP